MPTYINPRRQKVESEPGRLSATEKSPAGAGPVKATLGERRYVALPSWQSEAYRFIIFPTKITENRIFPEYFLQETN
jgi:hypothetical protein